MRSKTAQEALQKAQAQLAESVMFTRTLLSSLPVPVFVKDREGRYVDCNLAFTEVQGATAAEIQGKTVGDLWPTEYAEFHHQKDVELMRTGQKQRYESRILDRHGGQREVLFVKDVFRDAMGEAAGIVGMYLDITEQKRAEEAVRESEEKLRAISSSANDGIVMMDADDRISFWNKAAEQIFGYHAEEVLGKCLHGLLAPTRYHETVYERLKRFHETGEGGAAGRTMELMALRQNGQEFPIELSLAGVRLRDQWHAVGVVRDITERKQHEESLQVAARTDGLTGLANRSLLCDRLQQAILRAGRLPDYHFAVLYLDFDRFKLVNDSLGHDAGDQLLQEIARRLSRVIRRGDSLGRGQQEHTSARLGGRRIRHSAGRGSPAS